MAAQAPSAPGTDLGDASLADIFREFQKGVDKQLGKEDYETRYNLGIAYKEMGLVDEAIAEFQLAAKDEARLLECASMLGICFLEKGMPKLAVKWFEKGLSAPGRSEEEYQGLRYDLASALEQAGETDRALALFTELYGQDASFRDVADKVRQLGDGRERPRPAISRRPLAPVLWILSSLVVGIVLVFAPWWPSLWDSNWLLQLWPGLRGPLLSAFTRGAVTGLGLVNVLLALADVTPVPRRARAPPLKRESRSLGAGESEQAAVDALFAEALRAGESRPRAREALARARDEQVLAAVLRRAVPVAFLEEVASARPWSERPRVLARVVLNPRAPRSLSLRLVSALYWRDLADVAATPSVPAAVRSRAESLLTGRPARHAPRGPRHARPPGDARPPARAARGHRTAGGRVGPREPAPARGRPRHRPAPGRRHARPRRGGGRLAALGRRATRCGWLSSCSRARRCPSRCSRSARSCPATCGAWRTRRGCARSCGPRPWPSSTGRRAPDGPPIPDGSTRCI